MVSARGWTEHSAMERKGNLAQENTILKNVSAREGHSRQRDSMED